MKILSVELKNFRQFYGRQIVHFSTDEEKNITLIHAENGVGKTAFLNAILWCFYAKTTDNFSNAQNLLNDSAANEGQTSLFVQIEFEEDGHIFSAIRTLNAKTRDTKFEVYRVVDNNYEMVKPDPNLFINNIIPKDMANYFFFQGEGVGSLAQDAGGGQIKRAVRDILGFKVAEEAKNDLAKIKTSYRTELRKVDKADEISSKEDELSDHEKILKNQQNDLEDRNKEQNLYSEQIAVANKFLANSNHVVVKRKHAERNDMEMQLKVRRKELADAHSKKIRLIRDYSYVAFASELSLQGLDFIDEEELKGKLPAPLNVQVVKDIVEREECLCGAPIHPGTQAFENIQKLTKDAADPALLNRIHSARSQLTLVQDKLGNAKGDLTENYGVCEQKEKEIADLEHRKEAISIEIDDVNLEDISRFNKNLRLAENKKMETVRAMARLERDIEETEGKIQSIRASLSRVSHLDRDVKNFKRLIDTTDQILETINETLSSTEALVRRELYKKINSFLEKFVRQDYTAEIDPETYAIQLINRDDKPVGASDGQRLILSLTFISSLLEIARERKKLSSNILTAGAIAPFVIDAPFGVLDNMYKANIAEVIPQSVGQVIFLLSSSHWEGSVEEKLRKKVGKEYNLLLEVASPQNGREANIIRIEGTDYQTAVYDAEKDRTIIQEVGNYV
ncbi:hypothetical protein A9Q83_04310 [Alphaproteobacteria bacterium 46_93_T64]|nr:hypothetical protein A9Q83_04310 [Alphaproteobacteria bacterium 46_93_T64]